MNNIKTIEMQIKMSFSSVNKQQTSLIPNHNWKSQKSIKVKWSQVTYKLEKKKQQLTSANNIFVEKEQVEPVNTNETMKTNEIELNRIEQDIQR